MLVATFTAGATLFDLLSGAPPFADDTVVNILLHVVTKEAPSLRSRNPLLPPALDTICARCLARTRSSAMAQQRLWPRTCGGRSTPSASSPSE